MSDYEREPAVHVRFVTDEEAAGSDEEPETRILMTDGKPTIEKTVVSERAPEPEREPGP